MKSEPATTADGFQSGGGRPYSGLPGTVVMNLSYTGLGIARSLGARGVPVTGLSATGGVYGNFTRYAKVLRCPDSKEEPEALLDLLLRLGAKADHKQIVFPTRDHDVVFLDRFREELDPYFVAMIPPRDSLSACLDKWETFRAARRAGVSTPACWKIEAAADLEAAIGQMRFPCVLKPLEAHHWRGSGTWGRVGGRKAICVHSAGELRREYAAVSAVECRALVQELVPGDDDQLFVAACYLDARSELRAGFTARKLVQVPEGFGTGCVVQAADRPELMAAAVRLLREIGFEVICVVEFKCDFL
jgi:predicted ATP-grasp superfamily ATP-dependent carboligase